MRARRILMQFSGFALLAAIITGCSPSQNSPHEVTQANASASNRPSIAVIDLREVARQTGAMDRIEQSLQKAELQLQGRLSQLKTELDSRLQLDRDRLEGEGDNGQSELRTLVAQYQARFAEEAQTAQNQLAAHHNQMELKLLNDIRPTAREIAQELGISVILTTQQVFSADPSYDITAKVIERIQAASQSSSLNDPPARTAELPGGGEFRPY